VAHLLLSKQPGLQKEKRSKERTRRGSSSKVILAISKRASAMAPNMRGRLGLSSGSGVEEVCEVPKGAESHGTRTCFPLAMLCKLGGEQK
jgi:hypothetical protein